MRVHVTGRRARRAGRLANDRAAIGRGDTLAMERDGNELGANAMRTNPVPANAITTNPNPSSAVTIDVINLIPFESRESRESLISK